MDDVIPDEQLSRLSEFVADAMGLDFPRARWPDLRRGIAATAEALGIESAAKCARWLMSAPLTHPQLEALASNLTVGETYFFREKKSFDALGEHVIPKLVAARRGRTQHVRIWSAACCTGEEAYSIAIVLHRTIPDLGDWNITILATDINPQFLRKAEAGVFSRWSFRGAPVWLKRDYFKPAAEGQFAIIPQIKQMVTFAQLNLAEDVYPSLTNNTNAMDVIFCRNVLMYFTAPRAKKVVENLHRAQIEGGWLIVSPSELLHIASSGYKSAHIGDVMFYQKLDVAPSQVVKFAPAPLPIRVEQKIVTPKPPVESKPQEAAPASFRESARSFANEGKLVEALNCCDEWVAADKLDPSAHYLRAIVLQEQGVVNDAVISFRKSIYLDPNFTLAHLALGHIARRRGETREAEKHLSNALRLLGRYRPDEILPESDGITAGRMTEIVSSLLNVESNN